MSIAAADRLFGLLGDIISLVETQSTQSMIHDLAVMMGRQVLLQESVNNLLISCDRRLLTLEQKMDTLIAGSGGVADEIKDFNQSFFAGNGHIPARLRLLASIATQIQELRFAQLMAVKAQDDAMKLAFDLDNSNRLAVPASGEFGELE